MTEKDDASCVCAECGHEQPSMDPCGRCRSVRVVLVSAIRLLFGDDWRSAFTPKAMTPGDIFRVTRRVMLRTERGESDVSPLECAQSDRALIAMHNLLSSFLIDSQSLSVASRSMSIAQIHLLNQLHLAVGL